MKNLFFVSVALSIFSGTSLTAFAQPSLKFIDGISLSNDLDQQKADVAVRTTLQQERFINKVKPVILAGSMATEMCGHLQFKFSQLLNREVESLTNISLFSFIDDWWHTRYRYGGTTKSGIDCSAFVGLLMGTVYSFHLPRTAREQYSATSRINKEEMVEGDLVFFNTRGGVSHVGLYLGDHYFVHSSVSSGVTISSLDDPYYAARFISGGRFNEGVMARN